MKFFFDRCMSIRLCKMVDVLEASKHQLIHHDGDSRFTQNTSDVEWISEIAKDTVKPIVISGDCKILKRPDEVAALKASTLTFFVMANHWVDFGIYDQVWRFMKVWPLIVKEAAVAEPTVFHINHGQSMKIEPYALTKNLKKK